MPHPDPLETEESVRPIFYFGAADRQLETFVNQSEFDRSLLASLFFQGDLLIPDIFFFISSRLKKHILGRPETLIGAAIEAGSIVPAFRGENCENFTAALAQIRRDRIAGVLLSADEIASALGAYRPRIFQRWSAAELGAGFQGRLISLLQAPHPPGIGEMQECSPAVAQKWETSWTKTARWRHDCINEAVEGAERALKSGERQIALTRGDVMAAVGRSLGYKGREGRVDDLRDIAPLAREQRSALREFWLWLTEIYQVNGARALRVAHEFSQVKAANALIPVASVQGGKDETAAAIGTDIVTETIVEDVIFPPLSTLLRVAPRDLLRVREEEGRPYFEAVRAWAGSRDRASADRVIYHLKQYAQKMTDWVTRAHSGKMARLALTLTTGRGGTLRRVVSFLIAGGVSVAGAKGGSVFTGIPAGLLVMLVSDAGCLCLQYMSPQPRRQKVVLRAPEIEVGLKRLPKN